MKWNDENVALLKKLWKEGLSASQVARRLGCDSRSAVIGKIHRLGLSGRATTSRMKSHRPRPAAKKPKPAKPARPIHFAGKSPASARLYDQGAAHVPYVPPGGDLEIPLNGRKQLIDLEAEDCHWPIGDPQMADFHFCNRKHVPGLPYCEFHALRAYQPPQPKRSEGGMQPAAAPKVREREEV